MAEWRGWDSVGVARFFRLAGALASGRPATAIGPPLPPGPPGCRRVGAASGGRCIRADPAVDATGYGATPVARRFVQPRFARRMVRHFGPPKNLVNKVWNVRFGRPAARIPGRIVGTAGRPVVLRTQNTLFFSSRSGEESNSRPLRPEKSLALRTKINFSRELKG